MAFPPTKKPDMTMILGIGGKRSPQEAPPSFGKKPDAMATEPPADADDAVGAGIPPEAVSYRTGDKKCASCEYMADSGECDKLKMQVEPEASCNLFENKGGADEGMGAEPDLGSEQQ